jgi:hypothetical protein
MSLNPPSVQIFYSAQLAVTVIDKSRWRKGNVDVGLQTLSEWAETKIYCITISVIVALECTIRMYHENEERWKFGGTYRLLL